MTPFDTFCCCLTNQFLREGFLPREQYIGRLWPPKTSDKRTISDVVLNWSFVGDDKSLARSYEHRRKRPWLTIHHEIVGSARTSLARLILSSRNRVAVIISLVELPYSRYCKSLFPLLTAFDLALLYSNTTQTTYTLDHVTFAFWKRRRWWQQRTTTSRTLWHKTAQQWRRFFCA